MVDILLDRESAEEVGTRVLWMVWELLERRFASLHCTIGIG